MTTTLPHDIDALKELLGKVTSGPWNVDGPKQMVIDGPVHRVLNPCRFPAAFVPAWEPIEPGDVDGTQEAIANSQFIALARNALPAILERMRLLEAVAEAAQGVWRLKSEPEPDPITTVKIYLANVERALSALTPPPSSTGRE